MVVMGSLPITVCPGSTEDPSTELSESAKKALDELNSRIIDKGEQISLREVYRILGIEHHLMSESDIFDCWGWDRKGFRKLYRKVVNITYEPIYSTTSTTSWKGV